MVDGSKASKDQGVCRVAPACIINSSYAFNTPSVCLPWTERRVTTQHTIPYARSATMYWHEGHEAGAIDFVEAVHQLRQSGWLGAYRLLAHHSSIMFQLSGRVPVTAKFSTMRRMRGQKATVSSMPSHKLQWNGWRNACRFEKNMKDVESRKYVETAAMHINPCIACRAPQLCLPCINLYFNDPVCKSRHAGGC